LSFGLLTLIFTGIGGAFLLLLGYLFWTNPKLGLEQTGHHAENLPSVMADRYFAFALLGLFAVIYQDLNVILAFFAACTLMAFMDARIYHLAEKKTIKHLMAGALSVVAFAVTVLAKLTEGAA
jgi:uncharacterized membrane-anchored protein